MTKTINVNEARHDLGELLALAKAGHEVIISEGDTPVARLTALAPAARPARVAGLHAGAIAISEDFDEPLSDDFWLGAA